jgi:hypothetical protein
MAVSAFQKVLNRLFKEFALRNGREPQTPKEWMDLQNEAVRYFNLTKGKGVTGSVRTSGGDVRPIADPTIGFKPKVIQGGKGIESLLKSGDVKKGVAPKTKLSTLEGKKQKLDTAISKEEWIAKKQRENKEAVERFKKKHGKKTVEDFRDEGDWDPSGFAGGGLVKKFIERLFIKASNDIRQGKGKWKGLTQDQWIKQHDNLTKMVKQWEWGGKKRLPPGAEEYIGMNDLQIARAVKQAEKKVKKPKMTGDENLDYEWKETPEGWVKVPGSEGAFYRFGKKHKDFIDKGVSKMVGGVDERTALKQKYPGIADDLIEQILVDDNPQRKAEVLATMDQYLKLKEVGKGSDEAFRLVTESIKDPIKHAEGGRADFIFGGSAGLKALLKRLRPKDQKRVFPLPPPGLKKFMSQADTDYIDDLKLQQLETILKAAKIDKESLAHSFKVKKMNDPGLDFLMGKLEESGLKAKNLDKYTNIDKDIMDIEMMIKNYSQKKLKRKPHQSGGLAYMLGEPTYMKYNIGGPVGHAPWHKPTGQPQPQGPDESPTPQLGGAQSPGRGQPNPMKAPRLPSVAPRTMDPQYMQQQAMQRMMMGQGQQRMGMEEGGFTQDDFNRFLKEREQMHREGGKHRLKEDWEKYKRFKQYGPGSVQEAADGGRIGMMYGGDPGFQFEYGGSWADWRDSHQHQMPVTDYIKTKLPKERLPFRDMQSGGIARLPFSVGGFNKGRRAFMKWLAGIMGTGVAAGTGLLKLGKTAPKVIPKAAEVITRGPDGIPNYAYSLIEVVKAKGTKEIMEGLYRKNPPQTKYNYKGVEVTEDGLGNTSVRKEMEETKAWNDEINDDVIVEDVVDREVGFEIRKGGTGVKDEGLETQKVIQGADEYDESTAFMQGDYEGGIDVSDIVEKIDDVDHLELKKIADEVDTLHTQDHHKTLRRKKASGGLAYALGE